MFRCNSSVGKTPARPIAHATKALLSIPATPLSIIAQVANSLFDWRTTWFMITAARLEMSLRAVAYIFTRIE